ncbi:MAG TPA: cytidylate kinase-like family protein [Gemmatimonadaceae bacterium]|nr:cytidylate kinase-like family protein [Gemmatimonadaceae bacterium]
MRIAQTRLITVSREFGAGGSELAAAVGAQLGWPVLDQELIHRVAERLRCAHTTVEHLDEHPPSLAARIAAVLIMPQSEMISFPPATDVVTADRIAEATRAAIVEAGKSPPLVVVGHGAQCIFAGRDDALHVRVVAPVEARVERVMQRFGIDAAGAMTMLRRADADRQAYVQRHFHQNWRSELLYDVLINTGRVSIADAATIVVEAAARCERAGAGDARLTDAPGAPIARARDTAPGFRPQETAARYATGGAGDAPAQEA